MASNGMEQILILSLIILLLILILLIMIIYIMMLKCRRSKGGHSVEGQECPHQHSTQHLAGLVNSLMNFQTTRAWSQVVNPVYVPDDPDHRIVMHVDNFGMGTPLSERNEIGIPDQTIMEDETDQLEVLSPNDCSSGRLDNQLAELLKPNMKESVTVEVDSKLLVFISREIDHTGGHLVLDKMGISLFIPPCAIPPGQKEIIQLVLDWDLSDFPSMGDNQTIVSPVVHCGPHGLKLAKPAVLSFMHCVDDTKDIVIMTSETHLTHPKNWQQMSERKRCHRKRKYDVLENQCQIYLSHFSLYTCLADGMETKKWIQLVAFGGKLTVGGHYQVFVYMLNNTPCALQFATQQQAKYDSFQVRCPLEFLYDAIGGDLIFKLNHLSVGWSCEGVKMEERGLFPDIWQGKCNKVSFVFKHENPAVTDIAFNIEVFQKDKEHEKRSMQVTKSMPKTLHRQEAQRLCHSTTNVNVITHDCHHLFSEGCDSGISMNNSETTSFKSVVVGGRQEPVLLLNESAFSGQDNDTVNCCDIRSSRDSSDDDHVESVDELRSTPSTSHRIGRDSTEDSASVHSPVRININVQPSSSVHHSAGLVETVPSVTSPPDRFFPHRLRVELGELLDPPNVLGNDWRILAEGLEMDHLINWLRSKTNPTDILLDEALQRGLNYEWLVRVLSAASRRDAVDTIKKYEPPSRYEDCV